MVENDDRDWMSYRDDYIFPLMPALKSGVWHRTTKDGFLGINSTGFIMPNQKGDFPYTTAQSQHFYGHSRGYICLFDFESVCEEDYACNVDIWNHFFVDQVPFTVLLRIDRSGLPKLIPNSSAPKSEYGYIGFVESWYPEPIPVTCVNRVIITKWNQGKFAVDILLDSEIG